MVAAAGLLMAACTSGVLSPSTTGDPGPRASTTAPGVSYAPGASGSSSTSAAAGPAPSAAGPVPGSTTPAPSTDAAAGPVSGSTTPAPSTDAAAGPSSPDPAVPVQDHRAAAADPAAVGFPGCPGVRCLTVAVTGDVLLHPQLIEQARADADDDPDAAVDGMEFRTMMAAQRPFVAGADVGICHMETPLAPAAGPFSNYPAFSVPPQVLPALVDTGYDACTTASNHTLDQGTDGLNRTLDDLDAAGLAHDGSYRSAADGRSPVIISTPNGRIGLISAAYGFNGAEPEEAWQVNTIDVDLLKARAAAAKQAGADVVVVALHAGEEYDHSPNAQQKDAARELLADPDVDLVYGHHAHVVQPMERIAGKWAIYGLGNNLAAQLNSAPGVQQGLLVRVQFSQDPAGVWTTSDVAWVASYQAPGPPYRWCALSPADTCGTGDGSALADTTAVVNRWGADTDGGAHRLN